MKIKKALDAAIAKLEKDFGKGMVMKLDRQPVSVETPEGTFKSGYCTGTRRCSKRDVWLEIYGPESSGKTTVALHMISEVQKRGGIAGFIDAEHALDPVYARNIGVDIDELYISQPDSGVSGALRLLRQWRVPARWILLSLTLLQRLYRSRRLKEIWEIPM